MSLAGVVDKVSVMQFAATIKYAHMQMSIEHLLRLWFSSLDTGRDVGIAVLAVEQFSVKNMMAEFTPRYD